MTKVQDRGAILISQLDTIQDVMDDVRLVLDAYVKVHESLSEEEFEALDGTPTGNLFCTIEDLLYDVEEAEK